MRIKRKGVVSLALGLCLAFGTTYAMARSEIDKLDVDTGVGQTIEITEDTTYDLNGHTLIFTGTGSVFTVRNGATLIVTDSAGGGKITGGSALGQGESETGMDGYGSGVHYGNDCGGGVYVESGGKLIMSGGAITGCSAVQGGGVFLESGAELHVSGAASITGNTNGNGEADNVWLPLDASHEQAPIIIDGALNDGSVFGVTTAATLDKGKLIVTSGLKGMGSAATFSSDEGHYVYLNAEGEAVFSTKKQDNSSGSDNGGSDYSGGGTPTTPTTTVTVPVSGDDETVNVKVEIKDDTATIKEADIDKVLEAEDVGTVTIDVSSLDENIDEAIIPGDMVKKIADAVADESNDANGLEIKLPSGEISFDADAVAAIAEQANGKDLTIHLDDVKVKELSSEQQEAVKELEVEIVLDAYLTSDGQRISDFKGGKATVSVPYELKEGQIAQGLVVWYVAEDGTKTQVPAAYDGKNIIFTVSHFSNYIVAYDAEKAAACPQDETCPMSAFSDLDPTLWYHDGIHFCLENGMMNGVGGGRFDPYGTTSRAMIVTILYRMEKEPEVTGKENPFSDVEDGKWYTDAVIWAAENKIVEGYGNGKFDPNGDITREQLATILYRYAQSKGQGFTGAWMFLLDYPDASEISSWADEAMHWCVMNGIINGKDGKLVPGGDASRAEAATMLQRFCTLDAE